MEKEIKTPLNELLSRNEVSLDDFLKETYDCMIVSILEALIDEMSDEDYKKKVRERIRKSDNLHLTVKKIVFENTDCHLNDQEAEQILEYLFAFFKKTSTRKVYDNSVRLKKLNEQNGQCRICKAKINIKNSELDHIIPWSMVGDELGEKNLQMLCIDCNRRKSKNVTYNLKMFLINKG